MKNTRGKILWVDDEINFLRPHILFLEEKGYSVATATNGHDAITAVEENVFNLVLMDQFMPGMDGMDTLRQIKELRPALPVIMITKSEEEWLMDEAISEKVEQFLIKPVNPIQILMACKQLLETDKIQEEKVTSGYLKEFQEIEYRLHEPMNIDDWWETYNQLIRWQLEFDKHKDTGLGNILEEQILTCNREFVNFIDDNYTDWLSGNTRLPLSMDVVKNTVVPLLEKNEKVCFIVVDSLRHDQFMTLAPMLNSLFDMKVDYHISILPTATPFSRNSIFSGLSPDKTNKKYPQQAEAFRTHAHSLNQFEKDFLSDQLKRVGLVEKRFHYHKIWQAREGIRFLNQVSNYMHLDLLAVVVNFVDMLAHKRSESEVLKEMVPDESGYRYAVKTWFENSWLYRLLRQLSESDYNVVLTSDHGSIRVQRGVMVGADRETSSGIRYKYGRNLNSKDKNALIIKKPKEYLLPEMGPQTNYLIAKDDVYFLYPTQFHKYQNLYKGSFQHGGISMEEMLVPLAVMRNKNR